MSSNSNNTISNQEVRSIPLSSLSPTSLGTHRLEYYAVDRMNNATAISSISFSIPPYTIAGNRLIDNSTGNEIILYGVHISRQEIFDPSKEKAFRNWRDVKTFLEKDILELKSIGANAVRLGISPAWMRYNTDAEPRVDYYIQSAIDVAVENNMYVLLDFHAVDSTVYPYEKGGFTYGKKYHDEKTTYQLMKEFWSRYAPLYSEGLYQRYVFYELFNEEVRNAENLDEWLDYKAKMESVIKDIIRPVAPQNIIIVNGLNNGLNLRRVAQSTDYRIQDPSNRLIYGWHAYPNSIGTYSKRESLTPAEFDNAARSSWDWNLGYRYKKGVPDLFPVILTEFGWRDPDVRTDLTQAQKDEYGARYVRGDSSRSPHYGKTLLLYAAGKIKGYFLFRFYYEKLAIVNSMPDWWNPSRSYTYTSDYGVIIKPWYTDKSIPS